MAYTHATLRHGVPITPTMQCDEQPVSEHFLAGVLWELQHVDAGEVNWDSKGKAMRVSQRGQLYLIQVT